MQKRLVQAYKMQQKNKAILVDVREAKYYNKGHASGCLNVGLFRSVEGRTPLDNLKRLAMAGFAMEATGEGRGRTTLNTGITMRAFVMPCTKLTSAAWS